MTSRRHFKREIRNIAEEIYLICILHRLQNPSCDIEQTKTIIKDTMAIQKEYIRRINHTEPGDAKAYYRHLHRSFDDTMDKLIDTIEALIKKTTNK